MADRNLTFQNLTQAIDRVTSSASSPYDGRPSNTPRVYRLDQTNGFSLGLNAANAENSRIEAPFTVAPLIDYNLATNSYSQRFAALRNAVRRAPRYRGTEDA